MPGAPGFHQCGHSLLQIGELLSSPLHFIVAPKIHPRPLLKPRQHVRRLYQCFPLPLLFPLLTLGSQLSTPHLHDTHHVVLLCACVAQQARLRPDVINKRVQRTTVHEPLR